MWHFPIKSAVPLWGIITIFITIFIIYLLRFKLVIRTTRAPSRFTIQSWFLSINVHQCPSMTANVPKNTSVVPLNPKRTGQYEISESKFYGCILSRLPNLSTQFDIMNTSGLVCGQTCRSNSDWWRLLRHQRVCLEGECKHKLWTATLNQMRLINESIDEAIADLSNQKTTTKTSSATHYDLSKFSV